jgi:hypothetical protein
MQLNYVYGIVIFTFLQSTINFKWNPIIMKEIQIFTLETKFKMNYKS